MDDQVLQIDTVLKALGLSSSDLFNRMSEKGFKLSKTSISHIITGKHSPKIETLVQIAEALNVDVSDLIKRTKDVSPKSRIENIERELEELKKIL